MTVEALEAQRRALPGWVRHLARYGFATLLIYLGLMLLTLPVGAAPADTAWWGDSWVDALWVIIPAAWLLTTVAWFLWAGLGALGRLRRRRPGTAPSAPRPTGRLRAALDPGRWRTRWMVSYLAVLGGVGVVLFLVIAGLATANWLNPMPEGPPAMMSAYGAFLLIAGVLAVYVVYPAWIVIFLLTWVASAFWPRRTRSQPVSHR